MGAGGEERMRGSCIAVFVATLYSVPGHRSSGIVVISCSGFHKLFACHSVHVCTRTN